MELSHRPAGAEGGMAGEGWPELAEQVFEALLTQTTVGFALLDADLRYVTLNEHLAQINGVPVEDHLGRALSEVLPHFAPVAEVPFREVLRTGSPMADLQFSAEVPGTGAVLRHWVESAYPVRDATGATAGIAVLVWEVTDRVEAERRREQMLGLLDVLIRQAPIGIAFLDRRLRYVRINENLAAANGRSVEEHLGRPLPEVVPGIAHHLVPPLEEVLSTGRPIIDAQLETPPMPAEPGRRRYWQISYYPVPSPVAGAPPEGVGLIVTDQTERVEAERERARLHEAERAARAAAEQAQARLDLLARASDLLGRSLDEGDVLAQLARLVVPDLADWLVVLMPDGQGPARAPAVGARRCRVGGHGRGGGRRRLGRVADRVGRPRRRRVPQRAPAAHRRHPAVPARSRDPGVDRGVGRRAGAEPGAARAHGRPGAQRRRPLAGEHHRPRRHARRRPRALRRSRSPGRASPSTTRGCSASAP